MKTTQTSTRLRPSTSTLAVAVSAPHAARRRATRSAWAILTLLAAAVAPVQAQDRVDVEQARQALARGAVAWDLRATGAVVPGAARISSHALRAWMEQGDNDALAQAVSAVGLNLSAEVLLVADDDATARAVAERVGPLARGRLAWLAGGTAAWQAAGLPLDTAPTVRLPMPQRLSLAAPAQAGARPAVAPADAGRRATATMSVDWPALTAAAAAVPVRR